MSADDLAKIAGYAWILLAGGFLLLVVIASIQNKIKAHRNKTPEQIQEEQKFEQQNTRTWLNVAPEATFIGMTKEGHGATEGYLQSGGEIHRGQFPRDTNGSWGGRIGRHSNLGRS